MNSVTPPIPPHVNSEGALVYNRRIALQALGLALLFAAAGCQRPTQRLPAAPQFTMDGQGGQTRLAEDALSVTDGGQLATNTETDFAAFTGSKTIYFEPDSAELTAEAKAVLARQGAWLLKYPAVRISLEGHADERGSREYAFAMGERRAAAMRFYLNSLGVENERMSVTSLGKDRPVVAGSDAQSWAQNRRGETVFPETPKR